MRVRIKTFSGKWLTLDSFFNEALEKLQLLDLSQNLNLTGTLWSNVSGWKGSLTALKLFQNSLTGSIPSEVGLLSHLLYLDLGSNRLEKTIPPELGALKKLRALLLNDNFITGQIPAQLGNLSDIADLELDGNWNLTGPIIPRLWSFLNLVRLYVTYILNIIVESNLNEVFRSRINFLLT